MTTAGPGDMTHAESGPHGRNWVKRSTRAGRAERSQTGRRMTQLNLEL